MVGDHVLQPIIGCIGFPVAGNSTQFVTERALKALGLDWSVITTSVPPALLEKAVTGAKAMRFAALALLDPHQVAVCQSLDQLTPTSLLSGQVQVAKRVDEVWIGHDVRGEAVAQVLMDKGGDPTRNTMVLGVPAMDRILAIVDPNLDGRVYSPESWQIAKEAWKVDPVRSENVSDVESPEAPGEASEPPAISVLLVSELKDESIEKQLAKLELVNQGLLIAMGDLQLHDGWKEWSSKRGWDYVSPLEFQSQIAAKMFAYWTQVEPPIHSIREWMDEYHEW